MDYEAGGRERRWIALTGSRRPASGYSTRQARLGCLQVRLGNKFQCVAWSPNGKGFATGSSDCVIRTWEPDSGWLMQTLEGHTGPVMSVAFSSDGAFIASGSEDQTVRVWESDSGRLLRTLDARAGPIRSVTFSTDGAYIADGADDHSVRVWESASGRLPRKLAGHSGPVRSVVFSSDGTYIASGADDHTVRVWASASGRLLRTLKGHSGPVRSVVFSPDAAHIVSGADDHTVCVWESASGQLLYTLKGHTRPVTSVAFSPDGVHITGGADDQTVRVWEFGSGRQLRTLEGHTRPVASVAFSPDGTHIASGADDPTVSVWESASGQLLHTLKGHTRPVTSVMFSPDGIRIVTGALDRTVRVWESASGQLIHTLEGHTRPVTSVAFSPDGARIVSGADDQTARVWDAVSGLVLRTLSARTGSVRSAVFSPDGFLIAIGADDQIVRLWESVSGRLLRKLEGHSGPVRSVVFSPDGTQIASGADDHTVRVWECVSGRLLRTLEGHTRPVTSVAFFLDGTRIVSSADDHTVRLWDAASGSGLEAHSVSSAGYRVAFAALLLQNPIAPAFRRAASSDDDIRYTALPIGPANAVSLPVTVQRVSVKIVLVGESQAGKSCVALRLTENRYQEQGTTHGMRLWSVAPETIHRLMRAPAGEEREVAIWDLGGQDEYRLVHQLFLNDTTVALIMFDPTRGLRAFEDVREWNLRLTQQLRGHAAVKLLIGTKSDLWPAGVLDRAGLEKLLIECGISKFIPTSAKTDEDPGFAELRGAIAQHVDWAVLSRTARRHMFQRVHDLITGLRQSGKLFVLNSELKDSMLAREGEEFDLDSLDTVLKHLVSQGALVPARLASGQSILILQIGYVEIYAGSLILMARNNPRKVPALDIGGLSRLATLPGINDEDRLPVLEERVVIECVVQLLLEHGICFEHQGLLIFPAVFPDATGAHDEGPEGVSLYYDFTGAVDNIYSSLVVMLALGGLFGRIQLSRNRAVYEQPNGVTCALRKIDHRSGSAHLDLLFGETTPKETRDLFAALIEDHLRREGVSIKEVLAITCLCGYQFQERSVRRRITDGHSDIVCPECEERCAITDPSWGVGEESQTRLLALKTRISRTKAHAANDVTRALAGARLFISYSHRDEDLKKELLNHLSSLRRESLISEWHDRRIAPGDDWRSAIDSNLESADLVLLLVSSDFMASDYCMEKEMTRAMQRHAAGDTRVIPVILRPVDWQAPFAQLQALPTDGRAVTVWTNRDEAFANVAAGIRAAVEQKLRPPTRGAPVTGTTKSILWTPQPKPPIRILHLSDLHFAESDDPVTRLQPLLQDLQDASDGFGGERLDYLVVSGDSTHSAAAIEFERVYQFLSQLIQKTGLSAERCILVPGNHDLSWDESPYSWKPARQVDSARVPKGHLIKQGDGYLVRDPKRYPDRFQNFRKFHHQFTQRAYAEQADRQYGVSLYEATGIQVLALNSAWEIDEQFPERSGIEPAALSNALTEADEQVSAARRDQRLAENADVLRIAVCHHPITGTGNIGDDAFVARLRKGAVRLYLHGHVHEDRTDVVRCTHPRKLHVVGAGSFGAATRHRSESIPRLYNLLEVQSDHSRVRVYTRRIAKSGGRWEGWAVWPSDSDNSGKQSYYDVNLAPDSAGIATTRS
jgi:small GTP-binding protein